MYLIELLIGIGGRRDRRITLAARKTFFVLFSEIMSGEDDGDAAAGTDRSVQRASMIEHRH